MTNELIQAAVTIISGGGIVAIYNVVAKARKAKRDAEQEPEQYIRTLLINQVSDLNTSIEAIRIKLEDLVAVNATLGEENRSLRIINKDLTSRIERTERLVTELTDKLN